MLRDWRLMLWGMACVYGSQWLFGVPQEWTPEHRFAVCVIIMSALWLVEIFRRENPHA